MFNSKRLYNEFLTNVTGTTWTVIKFIQNLFDKSLALLEFRFNLLPCGSILMIFERQSIMSLPPERLIGTARTDEGRPRLGRDTFLGSNRGR